MKLVSWNVNGLRALYKQGYWEWFEKTKPDIFCLQEIKVEEQQLPPEVQNPKGYSAYFNSSQGRKGYSGVAIYSKEEPFETLYDVLPKKFNAEGRLIQTRFKDFVLLNVYFPNGGRGKERLEFKLEFYDAFLEHIENLRQDGESVVFCGDFNVAHEEIDIARPKENADHTGFLPEERAWADELVAAGYIDTFRYLYPNKKDAYTYWDQVTHARDRNVGWRIDYFFISPDLLPKVRKAEILSDVYGSDHCPILLELDV
jgi:exodeoxyribonuclease-3